MGHIRRLSAQLQEGAESMSDNDLVKLIAVARTMLLPELVRHVEEQAEKIAGSFLDFQAAKTNEELAGAIINLGCAVDAVRAGITVLFDRLAQDGTLNPKRMEQARKIIEELEEEARWRADNTNVTHH
jgi:hypothetical protein